MGLLQFANDLLLFCQSCPALVSEISKQKCWTQVWHVFAIPQLPLFIPSFPNVFGCLWQPFIVENKLLRRQSLRDCVSFFFCEFYQTQANVEKKLMYFCCTKVTLSPTSNWHFVCKINTEAVFKIYFSPTFKSPCQWGPFRPKIKRKDGIEKFTKPWKYHKRQGNVQPQNSRCQSLAAGLMTRLVAKEWGVLSALISQCRLLPSGEWIHSLFHLAVKQKGTMFL